jgi:transposase
MLGCAFGYGLRHWLLCKGVPIDISLRTPDDVDELTRLIRQAHDAKQRDRLRAVQLAIAGEPTLTIMRMLGRSRGFAQRWCYAYRDHGLAAVSAKPPPGRPTRLPAGQHETFKQRVLLGPKDADGVCTLRGRDFIRILEEEFGVRYELSGVYDLLHRLNLSVLAPRPRHRKSDPEAMRQWVQDAPFLSATCKNNTPASVSPCGSRTKRGSASKAR